MVQAVQQVLAELVRACGYCSDGQCLVPLGGLFIEGFGPLPLPLPLVPAVAAALEPLSTPAPYGRGGQTLLDPGVRRCRQVPADRVHLASRAWREMLDRITQQAAAGLRRAPPRGCGCEDCRVLAAFMQDPDMNQLQVKMGKEHRKHMHRVVEAQGLDADTHTRRRGSPYTLVVTKTVGSYERDMAQHQVDLRRWKFVLGCDRPAAGAGDR